MWPLSEMSLPLATSLGNAASVALILSLVVGLIATLAIVLTTNVKEFHWDKDRENGELGKSPKLTKMGNRRAQKRRRPTREQPKRN